MHRNLKCVVVACVCLGTIGSVFAQTLRVTTYGVVQNPAGANIQAEYTQGDPPWCPPERVRWLQRVHITNPDGTTKNNVPGYPNGDFIDPQPTQPGGPWDNQPWYDVTYNSAADRNTDTNRQNGAGRFMNDSPRGWFGTWGPLCFTACTAVVCIDPATNTASFMGGFSWGFCVDGAGVVSQIAPSALANNAATMAKFNGALGTGPATFRAWTLAAGDPNCQLTFSAVPEPGTMAVLGLALLGFARRRRSKTA